MTVRLVDTAEVSELVRAASVLLATLGERGAIMSYDREPAVLARALDALHEALHGGRMQLVPHGGPGPHEVGR